jgi:5-dehydro-2-deoxygluconokinase
MLMFELLVTPTKAQLHRLNGDQKAYVRELHPGLMLQAICQLQDSGVEPTSEKSRGLIAAQTEKVVAAARRNGRDKEGCIILGRREDDAKVREWLAMAASVPGFIGSAVGRTSFW